MQVMDKLICKNFQKTLANQKSGCYTVATKAKGKQIPLTFTKVFDTSYSSQISEMNC